MIYKYFNSMLTVLTVLAVGLVVLPADSEAQTAGLSIDTGDAFQGYTLFAPLKSQTTYLIDNQGNFIHTWESDFHPGHSVYLLENGNLLRTAYTGNQTFTAGGAGGRVEEITPDGVVSWYFEYSSELYLLHHDVEFLPNGNILMIAWEYKTSSEAIAAGRNPDLLADNALWPDTIIEVKPDGASGGEIVWEWHAWDHLIQDYDPSKENYGTVADHPEKIDVNFYSTPRRGAGADWTHFNSVEYIEPFDQILISVHGFSEIWVIDHGLTTAEAAGDSGGRYGKGGDLLYRWGNPQTYGAGDASDQILFKQHDATWIPAGYPGEGNILIFNNGTGRPDGDYSSVEEISPPVDADGAYAPAFGLAYGPASPDWTYTAPEPTDFFSQNISGAQRLPNGATLVCSGASGRFFEVTSEKEIVWEYVNPVVGEDVLDQGDSIPTDNTGNQANQVFRVVRYAENYSGLAEIPGVSVAPAPDVKGNGSDGPITIGHGERLSLTVSLDSGSRKNENADWWIAASDPSGGWMHLDISEGSSGWKGGLSVTYQGPLADLPLVEVMNDSGLSEGAHVFYFGVDASMNGALDAADAFYFDSVTVTVSAAE